MKLGTIIETNDPEQAWNGVRFANAALTRGHQVQLFLMSAGVEIENISGGKYDAKAELEKFVQAGGTLFACGTCIQTRGKEESATCPISTMHDCVEMVEWADKTITF
jgi:sulfur relay (sulfurtransferase) complex TusBCD TusD component (DsrE family)